MHRKIKERAETERYCRGAASTDLLSHPSRRGEFPFLRSSTVLFLKDEIAQRFWCFEIEMDLTQQRIACLGFKPEVHQTFLIKKFRRKMDEFDIGNIEKPLAGGRNGGVSAFRQDPWSVHQFRQMVDDSENQSLFEGIFYILKSSKLRFQFV